MKNIIKTALVTLAFTFSQTAFSLSPVMVGESAVLTAYADSAYLQQDSYTTLSVLANDNVPYQIIALDVATPPAHGQFVVNSDNTITYVPDEGYVGDDSLTYMAVDISGTMSMGQVTIQIDPLQEGCVYVAAN